MDTHVREREGLARSRRDALRLGMSALMIGTPAAGLAAATSYLAGTVASPDPKERARRAWIEFSAAMDEIARAAGADGWMLGGAAARFPHPSRRDGRFLLPYAIFTEWDPDYLASGGMHVESIQPIDLGEVGPFETNSGKERT